MYKKLNYYIQNKIITCLHKSKLTPVMPHNPSKLIHLQLQIRVNRFPYFCNNLQVQTDLHEKFQQLESSLLARIPKKVLKNTFLGNSLWRNLKEFKNCNTDNNCLSRSNLWTISQLALLCNRQRYRLEIWYGSSIQKTGGPCA